MSVIFENFASHLVSILIEFYTHENLHREIDNGNIKNFPAKMHFMVHYLISKFSKVFALVVCLLFVTQNLTVCFLIFSFCFSFNALVQEEIVSILASKEAMKLCCTHG